MEEKQKYKVEGTLKKVNTKGKWNGIVVEKNGNSLMAATFKATDVTTANSLIGQEVEMIYTKNGEFMNLVEGGIKALGGTPVQTQVPTPAVEQTVIEEVVVDNSVPAPASAPTPVSTPVVPPTHKTESTFTVSDEYRRIQRQISIGYAKDLVVAGKVEIINIEMVAETILNYIINGPKIVTTLPQ